MQYNFPCSKFVKPVLYLLIWQSCKVRAGTVCLIMLLTPTCGCRATRLEEMGTWPEDEPYYPKPPFVPLKVLSTNCPPDLCLTNTTDLLQQLTGDSLLQLQSFPTLQGPGKAHGTWTAHACVCLHQTHL